MPYKKTTKKRTYKKKYVRRAAPRRTYRRIPRTSIGVPSGLPLQRVANLRYCTQGVIGCKEHVIGYYNIRANSPFDPEYNAGGGQPMGYDQWAALYDQYVVLGSKITAYISYKEQVAIDNPPMAVGIYLSDDAAIPYVDWQGLVEAKKGTFRMMTPMQSHPVKVMSRYSAKKYFNVTNVKDNVPRIGAPINKDPDDEAVYIIWGNTTGTHDATGSTALNVNIIVDYCILFSEPKDIPRS